MTHDIPYFIPLDQPLPIPHFFGLPDNTNDGFYHLIVPNNMILLEGHRIKIDGRDDGRLIKEIVERRPAKGDWSKNICKTPDFIRLR